MNPLQGLKQLYGRSRRLPVRIRIAIVSATLTAVILIGFAAVVGRLVTDRLHADFENELRGNVATLANGLKFDVENGRLTVVDPTNIAEISLANDAEIRVIGSDGTVLAQTPNTTAFGAPDPSRVVSAGSLEVATAQIFTNTVIGGSAPVLYAQYGRPESSVDDTIGRLWLFLGGGVAIGTLLAGVAGHGRREPGDATDLGPDGGRERHRDHPRPLQADPRTRERRRGRRAGADARPDAPRARRRPRRRPRARSSASASSSPTPPTSCAPR